MDSVAGTVWNRNGYGDGINPWSMLPEQFELAIFLPAISFY